MERIPTASVLKTTDYSFGLAFEMQAQNAGIFVSRGIGIHPKRIITSYELFFVKHGVLSIKEGDVDYEVHEGETLLLSRESNTKEPSHIPLIFNTIGYIFLLHLLELLIGKMK